TGRQELHSGWRVAAKHDLGVHFFARFVDAAVGERRAAKKRLRFIEIEVESELPRRDAVVPVARGVRGIAVFFSSDHEMQTEGVKRLDRNFLALLVLLVPLHAEI